MPSQNQSKLSTVLMAPAQIQNDGSLLVLAESSSTFPAIKDHTECWVINKMNWEREIKKKWTGFDPSMFQNAKTYTSNRPYNYDLNKNNNIYDIKAVDKVFSEWGKNPMLNKNPSYSHRNAFKNLPSQNKCDPPEYNLGI